MNKCGERLKNGIITENPIFVLMLGMCPTLFGDDRRHQWYWHGTFHNSSSVYVQYADLHSA